MCQIETNWTGYSQSSQYTTLSLSRPYNLACHTYLPLCNPLLAIPSFKATWGNTMQNWTCNDPTVSPYVPHRKYSIQTFIATAADCGWFWGPLRRLCLAFQLLRIDCKAPSNVCSKQTAIWVYGSQGKHSMTLCSPQFCILALSWPQMDRRSSKNQINCGPWNNVWVQ